MEKRVILAIVICAGIMFAWAKFFPGTPPEPPASPGAATTAATTPGQPTAPSAPGAPAPVPAVGAAPAAALPSAGAPASVPEQETVIETPVQRFVFTNRGAVLKHAQLREPKYLSRRGDPMSGIDLVRTTDPAQAPLRISFPDPKVQVPPDSAWQVVPPAAGADPNQVIYRAETPAIAIEKRFIVDKTHYRIHLDVTVQNRTGAAQDHHLGVQIAGVQDLEAKGSFLSGTTGNTSSLLCHLGGSITRDDIENLSKEPWQNKTGAVSWIGADEKFFLTAVVPYPEARLQDRTCKSTGYGPTVATGTLEFAARSLAPGARTQYSFAVYIGPKIIADLEEVRPGKQDVRLSDSVDVSLAFISRPMLGLLKLFHGVVKNWGVAIILLTIFIRLLTFYPTQKSLMSAKKMQKLGPKMAAIRKKYEGDRQRQSAETMNLYKAHGVSPFGGCLPSLIQMPIWIALYSTLNYAVELYRSPFFFHIKDLTAKDPYYVTPLLMGGVMFVQMKMSPTSPDNQQQAMMAIMMPVMFTAFSLVLPSGLAVYMLTSYLIGILQQLWVNHLDRKANAPAPAPGRS
jgi:YidC/Oxa1 family membrane protein insertase